VVQLLGLLGFPNMSFGASEHGALGREYNFIPTDEYAIRGFADRYIVTLNKIREQY